MNWGGGGDGLAQWLWRWTGDPKVEGSNPVSKDPVVHVRVRWIMETRK